MSNPAYRLRLDLHEGQLQIYNNRRRFNVVRCGRRFGKTVLALAMIAPKAAAGQPVAYMAPTYKMLMEFWRETKRTLQPLISNTNEQDKRIELVTGGIMDFWSLDNYDAIRGRKYAEIAVDEAATLSDLEEAWNMVLRPTLMDYKGGASFFSTPKGRNYFWVLDENAKRDEAWGSFHMPTSANPYIDAGELAAFAEAMPSIAYRQEILAEYVDLAGALMRRDYITYTDRVPDKLKVGIGVDLAISKRDGADYTAIVVMGYEEATGHRYVLDVVRERCSFNETLRLIQKVAEKHNPHKVLIEEVQFQASVVQELTRTTSLPIKGYKPDRDKVTRFHELLARYEQGLVFHRRGLLPEFDNELLAFPESEHDDMVDAAVYAHQACTAKARAGVVFI